MADDRKTVYVNDRPITIFIWAEVQHCVNAYDSDLFLKLRNGEAEMVDNRGDWIGRGGFTSDGWRIYVRLLNKEHPPIDRFRDLPHSNQLS